MSDLRNRISEHLKEGEELEPRSGHRDRFLKKLEEKTSVEGHPTSKSRIWLRIAAAIVVVLISATVIQLMMSDGNEGIEETASVNPEEEESTAFESDDRLPLEEATYYYKRSLDQQFASIEQFYADEDSKELIDHTKQMISELEKEYQKLEIELQKTGDERIVVAMISNYQSRIGLLEELIIKLKYIKQIKEGNHENNQNA